MLRSSSPAFRVHRGPQETDRACGKASSVDREDRGFWADRLQGKVESVCRVLPEVRMSALASPQPGILQLLVAPEGRQSIDIVAQFVAALSGRCRKIEKACHRRQTAGLHAAERRSV